MKVIFLDALNEIEFEKEMTAEELRLIVDLKPTIYGADCEFKTDGELEYHSELGGFRLHISQA